MNGELAQVIALATHGTAWLQDPREPAPALNQTSSTFKFVRSLEFVIDDRKGLLRRKQHAAIRDVATWLDRFSSTRNDSTLARDSYA